MSRIQDILESHFGTHVDQDDAPLIVALEDGIRAEAALVVARYQIERAIAQLESAAFTPWIDDEDYNHRMTETSISVLAQLKAFLEA